MTVKAQLLFTFSLVTMLMAVPAIYGVTQLADLRDIASALSGGHAEAIHTVGRIQTDLVRFDRAASSYVSFGAPEHRTGMEESLGSVRRDWERLQPYHEAAGVSEEWLVLLDQSSGQIAQLVSDGDFTQATAAFLENVRPVIDSADGPLRAVARAIDGGGAAEVAEAQRISATATRTALLGMLGAFALALALAGWMTRALISPLRRLRDGMASVADGHFAPPPELPYGGKNEIGDLSRSFRAMAWRLAELDRLKAEFVSVIGHDLKTPLNIITGYTDLVEEGYGEMSDDQKEMLAAILDQSRLLTHLANQLLNLSKIEAGGFRIHPEEVEIAHFLSVVRRSFVPLAARKSIDFSITVDASAPESIVADADLLQNEVLGNLLTNAFKFTPPGGLVVLAIARDSQGLRFTVSDTGIGIPAEHLPFIFEKYYRVGKDARGDGSGLGLAIAREIVSAHGGTIQATSDADQGTSISFVLPITPVRAAQEVEVRGEVGAGA